MVDSGIRGLNACHDKVESGYKYNKISIYRSVYTSMDLRRDRKRSRKFREMLETQGYAQAQDAEEREAQSKRGVLLC